MVKNRADNAWTDCDSHTREIYLKGFLSSLTTTTTATCATNATFTHVFLGISHYAHAASDSVYPPYTSSTNNIAQVSSAVNLSAVLSTHFFRNIYKQWQPKSYVLHQSTNLLQKRTRWRPIRDSAVAESRLRTPKEA